MSDPSRLSAAPQHSRWPAAVSAGSEGSSDGGAVEIDLWTHSAGNPNEEVVIDQIIADFNASQSDYVVKKSSFPPGDLQRLGDRSRHRQRPALPPRRRRAGHAQLGVGWVDDGFLITQGWLNSYRVQIVPFIANAFSIFLFAQFYKSIPKELDEAARIDGAGWFRIHRSAVSPLAGPAFATSAILTFLPTWNSYLWPLRVVQQEEYRPVQVGVQYFFQLNTAWGEIMAYTTLITIPVVFFLMFQRAFVSSIASSGVKG